MINNNQEDQNNKILSLQEKQLLIIHDQIEEAKDPSTYESYSYRVSEADKKINLFMARRKGNSHVTNNTPCQDYCLVSSLNGCTILTDADGVSSCEHSDVGAKLACEAVIQAVEAASMSCDEKQLLSRLMSISFVDRLVSIWINNVMDVVNKESLLSPEEQSIEFAKYGSTIMFAILTKNWIVTGNLGDGQILVFNDDYGVKLRVHAPKFDSRVRCLINVRDVREGFVINMYPRKYFNGVLLSTDGIYESLDKGAHFYKYSMQLKEKFLAKSPHEPYQPFCYQEDGEPYRDFSRRRTEDDCSIVMALDDRKISSDYDKILTSISKYSEDVMLKRWSLDCLSFYTRKENKSDDEINHNFECGNKNTENDSSQKNPSKGEKYIYSNILVSKDNSVCLPIDLKSAIIEKPIETWCDNGFFYSLYEDTGLNTLEFLHSSGMLRQNKNNFNDFDHKILDIYLKIKNLKRELNNAGLELNSSAIFNLFYDGENLYIRREAVRPAKKASKFNLLDILSSNYSSNENFIKMDMIDSYFNHFLGVMESEGTKLPIYDVGYVDKGIKGCRFNNPTELLFQLIKVKNQINLKNISSHSWRLSNGVFLQSGESTPLNDYIYFTLIDADGSDLESYKYTPKELL